MECTGTSSPYAAPLLPLFDGPNDATTAKGSVREGTVASRIRSLNELDRKSGASAKPAGGEGNPSHFKSVLSRAPPAIQQVDRSLQPTPQRTSPFVRRSAERLPTSPPAQPSHSAVHLHAPQPKVIVQRPTFFDISPGPSVVKYDARQWQDSGPSYLSTAADKSSNLGKAAQIQDTSDSANTSPNKQTARADHANPWGVTLRKSQPELSTRPPYSKPPHANSNATEDDMEDLLRKSRPSSPSIGIAPRNPIFGGTGGRTQPAPKDNSGSTSGDEANPEAPVTGTLEESHKIPAADHLASSEQQINDTRERIVDPPNLTGARYQIHRSDVPVTTLPNRMPMGPSIRPGTNQQQLDGGKFLSFDTVIKRQEIKLKEIIRQLKGCGPWLEEIRTLAYEMPSKTTYMEPSPDEHSEVHYGFGTLSSASQSDLSRSWEESEGTPERKRTKSLPDALVALNDAAETVSSIVKDIQPTAASEVFKAQSSQDAAQSALSLPALMKIPTGLQDSALVNPVLPGAGDIVTPRAHTVDINPAANLSPYWYSSPTAVSRYTLTPPPGRRMGKAMSHEALCRTLPFPIYPQSPPRKKPPALHRLQSAIVKPLRRSNTSSKPRRLSGPSSPGCTISSTSLSNDSPISQYSFRPTPSLYFSYQQIPSSTNPSAIDPTASSSYRDPTTSIPIDDQQGQYFPLYLKSGRGSPSSGSRDSPPPPPPGFMGYDLTISSSTTAAKGGRGKERAQPEEDVQNDSNIPAIEKNPPSQESEAEMKTSKVEGTSDHDETPIDKALSTVQEASQEFANGNHNSKDGLSLLSLAESVDVLEPSSAEPHLNNSDPTTVIHVAGSPEAPKQAPGAESDRDVTRPAPPGSPTHPLSEATGNDQPSEAEATVAPTSPTGHSASPRRPFPRPIQEHNKRNEQSQRHRASQEQQLLTLKRIEQWRLMVPTVRISRPHDTDPQPLPPSTAGSSLPPALPQHLDVRTRVRLLEAARRVKEMELEEARASAAAAAATAADTGVVDVDSEKPAADAEDHVVVGAGDEAAQALFQGGAREQIGSLDRPFW
ncbi:hypothetical protein IWX49DRAFT_623155 [Phyllosticta citricarpa]|uniref:Uncharacterized protein n=2 Tax=Phyllosticta TaxID=121621 RepID=A0ABR1MQN0_9PEZI